MAETTTKPTKAKAHEHIWWPLGTMFYDLGSAAYCVLCRKLAWVKGDEWERSRSREGKFIREHGVGALTHLSPEKVRELRRGRGSRG